MSLHQDTVDEALGYAEHVFLFKLMPQERRAELAATVRLYNSSANDIPAVRAGNATLLNVDVSYFSVNIHVGGKLSFLFAFLLQHKVFDNKKRLKSGILGYDGYHVSRGRGLSIMAGIVRMALVKKYGAWLKAPGPRQPIQNGPPPQCEECRAKGHSNGTCRTLL